MKFILDNWLLVAIVLASGSLLAWPLLRGSVGGAALSPQSAVHLINRQRAVVVDVRAPEDFASGHVVNAKNVPLEELEARLATTVRNKAQPLLLMCGSGARGQKAVAIAKKLGYEQAQAIAGGIKSWKEANLPIEKKA